MSAGDDRRGFAGAMPGHSTRGTDSRQGAGAPASDPERDAQEKLADLLHQLDAWEAELAGIYASLPAPGRAEADAMERGERAESLAHSLRTAIECLRIDGQPPARAILARAVATDRRDLEREWAANAQEVAPGGARHRAHPES
jgi:hypothetical protein